jgi:Skp family chaperone for outer membrane proteins
MTRKLRAEKLMQRKQKEINREGHRRIREAVKRVAERKGIERVYEKGDLLYKRGQSAENTGFMTDSRDITGAVLRELSADS